ncbi:hypothetical protein PO124_30775 [Bacillus licheniformis]|nr:hypothetical protein [Bacillus licheniformis]
MIYTRLEDIKDEFALTDEELQNKLEEARTKLLKTSGKNVSSCRR